MEKLIGEAALLKETNVFLRAAKNFIYFVLLNGMEIALGYYTGVSYTFVGAFMPVLAPGLFFALSYEALEILLQSIGLNPKEDKDRVTINAAHALLFSGVLWSEFFSTVLNRRYLNILVLSSLRYQDFNSLSAAQEERQKIYKDNKSNKDTEEAKKLSDKILGLRHSVGLISPDFDYNLYSFLKYLIKTNMMDFVTYLPLEVLTNFYCKKTPIFRGAVTMCARQTYATQIATLSAYVLTETIIHPHATLLWLKEQYNHPRMALGTEEPDTRTSFYQLVNRT